ncbi:unnamed protein product, partial [Musa hybrid cultivar]
TQEQPPIPPPFQPVEATFGTAIASTSTEARPPSSRGAEPTHRPNVPTRILSGAGAPSSSMVVIPSSSANAPAPATGGAAASSSMAAIPSSSANAPAPATGGAAASSSVAAIPSSSANEPAPVTGGAAASSSMVPVPS